MPTSSTDPSVMMRLIIAEHFRNRKLTEPTLGPEIENIEYKNSDNRLAGVGINLTMDAGLSVALRRSRYLFEAACG